MGRRRDRGRHEGAGSLPGPPPGRPTAVSWDIDYSYDFPVVDASRPSGWGVGPVDVLDAERLGIPGELGERLIGWARRWEDLAMRHVRDDAPAEWRTRAEQELERDQWALLDDLRRELDDDVELLVQGIPLDEWRQRQRRPGA